MTKIVKYELKKIFESKLFIGALVMAIITMTLSTIFVMISYNKGGRGNYALNQMDGKKLPETFISKNTIETHRKTLKDFESRDDIYISFEEYLTMHPEGGRIYHGKYEISQSETLEMYYKGEITEKELNEIWNYEANSPVIRDEFLPEYFLLKMPIDAWKNVEDKLSSDDSYFYENESQRYIEYVAKLNKVHQDNAKELIENGFTVGYDYGWNNIFDSLASQATLILAVVIIIGLCSVFTGEYTTNADALLLSSKKGRRYLASAKVISGVIYSIICTLSYIAISMLVSFIFLGTEGANVTGGLVAPDSHIERLFKIIPTIVLGGVLVALITLAVSAVSKKQITSVSVAVFLCLLPEIISWLIYVEPGFFDTLLHATPIYMITGGYISSDMYGMIGDKLVDVRTLFPVVAFIIIAITIPVIYRTYCKHQVKN